MGRPARGVRGMDLEEGDYLVGAEVVEKDGLILSISENGYGKRTPLDDYRLTARGGKGVINMKTDAEDRQGGGDPFGEGRFRSDDHHQATARSSASIRARSGRRAVDAGRAAGAHGRRRSGGRGLGDPGRRREGGTNGATGRTICRCSSYSGSELGYGRGTGRSTLTCAPRSNSAARRLSSRAPFWSPSACRATERFR